MVIVKVVCHVEVYNIGFGPRLLSLFKFNLILLNLFAGASR